MCCTNFGLENGCSTDLIHIFFEQYFFNCFPLLGTAPNARRNENSDAGNDIALLLVFFFEFVK